MRVVLAAVVLCALTDGSKVGSLRSAAGDSLQNDLNALKSALGDSSLEAQQSTQQGQQSTQQGQQSTQQTPQASPGAEGIQKFTNKTCTSPGEAGSTCFMRSALFPDADMTKAGRVVASK